MIYSAPPPRSLRLGGELLSVFLVLVFCFAPNTDARAHKFYASLAQADYNPRTKSLEISLRVFADDLELALTKRTGRAVYLDSTPDIAAQITAYLRERFELRGRDGKIKELKWVGMEPQIDSAWLYFEIPAIENFDGAHLRNRVLLEMYPDQVNTTIVKIGGEQRDFIFRVGDEDWREVLKTKAKEDSQKTSAGKTSEGSKNER